MNDDRAAPDESGEDSTHELGQASGSESPAPDQTPVESSDESTQPRQRRTWSTRTVVAATALAVALGAGGGAAVAALSDGGSSAPGHRFGPGMQPGPGDRGSHDGFDHHPQPGGLMPSRPPGNSWQPRR